MRELENSGEDKNSPNNKEWAHGRKHIFLSEGARQQLEQLRDAKRTRCATTIQAWWRGINERRRSKFGSRPQRNSGFGQPLNNNVFRNHPQQPQANGNGGNLNIMMQQHQLQLQPQRTARPKPISGTPPPLDVMQSDRCDFKTIQQTCALFGLDLVII